jgi:CRISPR-associated protein Cas2
MEYIVCYDIADNRRRERLAGVLLDFGKRVQESVFVADLDDELAARMKERVRGAIDPGWDKVHIFQCCRECSRKMEAMGEAVQLTERQYYVL